LAILKNNPLLHNGFCGVIKYGSRNNKLEIRRLERNLAAIALEEPPKVTVSKEGISELSEVLRCIVALAGEVAAPLWSFMDKVWMKPLSGLDTGQRFLPVTANR